MKKFAFLLLLALPLQADNHGEVCVLIDVLNTKHHKYPNQATEAFDLRKFFSVYHKRKACFDLDKVYYMRYFLEHSYITKCHYKPKPQDHGKILRYEGESNNSPCPILDEFRIGI